MNDAGRVGPPPPQRIASWQDAELNAVAWLRYFGYPDARLTPAGADEGIDVVAAGAVAQVKARRLEKVSRPDVQQLVGAAGRGDTRNLFFFAWSGYSPQALEYAERHHIAAFTFALDGATSPENESARRTILSAHSANPTAGSSTRPRIHETKLASPSRTAAATVAYVALLLVFGIGFSATGIAALIAGAKHSEAAGLVTVTGIALLLGAIALTVDHRRSGGRG